MVFPTQRPRITHVASKCSLTCQFLGLLVAVAVVNVALLPLISLMEQEETPTTISGGRALSNTLDTTTLDQSNSKKSYSLSNPYYLHGKTQYKENKFHRKKTFEAIATEAAKPIANPLDERVWVLPHSIDTPTRNHESVLLEYSSGHDDDHQVLINVLGRYSRVVQWMDLYTGQQHQVETPGTDPDGRPLNDLNHVASVLVDSLEDPDKKEIWLPCGFHNDQIGKEQSSNYVRIVDVETMQVRYGPKLPYSGGACGAAPIEASPGTPPLICAFGGTDGNHDTGEYLLGG
jgi:hypothetical protein